MSETPWWKKAYSKAELFLSEKPFLSSFLAALILVFPILLIFRVYFQLNDDNFMLFLYKGLGLNWSPSEMTQLENALLGIILKSLYVNFPTIQWYSGFLVLCEFLSLWGILASFQMGKHGFFKNFLFLLGTAAFSVHLFTDLQWTLTAASAAIGCFMLLAASWKREDSKYLYPALGLAFVLILLSVLIRSSALGLVGLASIPAVIYLTWRVQITPHRRVILWFLVVTAIFALGAIAFNNMKYDRHADWSDSTRFLSQHNELEDFQNPVYNETTKSVFDSIGWTELDLGLFRNWYFMDPDTYSLEKIQKLNDYFPHFAINKDSQDTFGAMFVLLKLSGWSPGSS